MNWSRIFFLTLTILIVNSCARNPVTGKRELVLMSEKQELAMGAQYDPQIISAYGLYENPSLQAFINQKGKEMAVISHRPDLDYKFRILDSPVVNAFAVPGGYVYFTRGIMAHFNNEAEFAGVLGHEIGHITARHTVKQQRNQTLLQIAFIGGLIFSPEFRNFADLANTGISLLFLKFSRSHEEESDKLGVEYSTEVGYNADEMAEFFNTLKKLNDEAGALPQFLSTHPDPGNRYNDVGNYADEVQSEKGLTDAQLKVNRDSYLSMIDGLIYGQDPKQGFVEDGKFYHPELLFEFGIPSGWQTNNTPSQVQLAPGDGKAVILFELEEGNNLNTAGDNVVQRNNITVIERNATTVNGLPALAISGEFTQQDQSSGATATLRVMTYLIQYNNLIYKFIGLSAKEDFNTYFGNFRQTMTSFKKLTDQSKINKLPQRIKIVQARRNSSFSNALKDYNVPTQNYNELALINGMELNETITSGTKFKILELRK